MKTLFLMSIVFAALAFPVIAAKDPDPRRGLRRLVILILVFNALYLFYVTQLHPVWFVPQRPGATWE